LAVGQKNGIVLLFDANTMNLTRKISDHKNPDRDVISTLRFSPDGNTLAVGYSPPISKVYLYDLRTEKVKKYAECKGASTRVTSIDFSMGGESLLATSIEPLFYKSSSGGQITAVSSLKA
jgi:microtubule-associated protein-like 6